MEKFEITARILSSAEERIFGKRYRAPVVCLKGTIPEGTVFGLTSYRGHKCPIKHQLYEVHRADEGQEIPVLAREIRNHDGFVFLNKGFFRYKTLMTLPFSLVKGGEVSGIFRKEEKRGEISSSAFAEEEISIFRHNARRADVVRWLGAYCDGRWTSTIRGMRESLRWELSNQALAQEVCAQSLITPCYVAGRSWCGLVVDLDHTFLSGIFSRDVYSGTNKNGKLHTEDLPFEGSFLPNPSQLGWATPLHRGETVDSADWSGHNEVWLGKSRIYKGITIPAHELTSKRKKFVKEMAEELHLSYVPWECLKKRRAPKE